MSLKLLLVEDNDGDFEIAHIAITRGIEGASIDRASTLKEAIRLISSTKYDAIMTDLRLPDNKTDLDAITTISHMTNTPLMVYSGSYLDRTYTEALQIGADKYIQKASFGMMKDIPSEIINMIESAGRENRMDELLDELRTRHITTS